MLLSISSLEESYDALQTFQILGIEKKPDISDTTCTLVSKTLGSSSSSLKDLFYALKVNGILKCDIDEEVFEVFLSSWICHSLVKNLVPDFHMLEDVYCVALMLIFLSFFFFSKGIKSRLQSVSNDASSLLDFYYSIGSLALIKVN